MNKHCQGCTHHWNAGHPKDTKLAKTHNDWCCKKGATAIKSIGWCKVHNAKDTVNAHKG